MAAEYALCSGQPSGGGQDTDARHAGEISLLSVTRYLTVEPRPPWPGAARDEPWREDQPPQTALPGTGPWWRPQTPSLRDPTHWRAPARSWRRVRTGSA